MKRHIKILTAVLLLLSLTGTACACGEAPVDRQQEQPKQTIQIPQVTVDLQDPENKVEVSAQEPSRVFDQLGNQLTDSQWLLNSKFAKSYIQSLGVGTYSFTYESDTATGTIQLIVTDAQKPNYVFSGEIPQTVEFLGSAFLPRLVKEQDSYQADHEVHYQLCHGETAIDLLEKPDGFQTEVLDAGDYLWTATLTQNGVEYTYSSAFRVQSFEEYLQSDWDAIFFDEQKKEYLTAEAGKFTVDTKGNADIYRYTVSQDVIDKAISAGKEWVILTIVTDKPYADTTDGENRGSFWMTNTWNGYNIGCTGQTPFVKDLRGTELSSVVSMTVENGKYVYCLKGDLRLGWFSESTPLQYFFADGIQCQAELTLSFQ